MGKQSTQVIFTILVLTLISICWAGTSKRQGNAENLRYTFASQGMWIIENFVF